MTKFNFVAAVAAAALLSGPAWAASLQPAAGEAPLFNDAGIVTSTVQRQNVETATAQHMPAAGEMSARAYQAPASMLTRAQVREATRQAIAQGFHVSAGEQS